MTEIAFAVDEGGRADEDVQDVNIRVVSSNTALIPDQNIQLLFEDDAKDATGGKLRIKPAPDLNGESIISLIVDDGQDSTTTEFAVNVTAIDDPPVISPINLGTTDEDTPILGVNFSVDEGGGADEEAPGALAAVGGGG